MKKLLYLLPFVLIGLSLTPFALYKDTVKYGSSLDTLSPSHWKVLDMQISASGSLDTFEEVDPNKQLAEPEPGSKNATFKGFPFGAYFSRSESSANSSFTASGYSWLWGGIDLLLIIASLVVSFKVNRKKKEIAPTSQPIATQPSVSPSTATPQVGEVQSGVFSLTHSPQQTVHYPKDQNMNINPGPNMTNFKVRRQKFGIGSLLFLVLFGAIFTGAGVFTLKSIKVDPSWTRVTGEVVESSSHTSDGSTTYSPVVKYEVNGQSYRVASSISSSSYPHIGEKREVAYNHSRPDQSKVVEGAGSTWWLYLFPAVGIACLALAPYAFIRSVKRSGNINRLMQSGQKLQGILVDVQSEGSDNNSGYKIVVSATDTSGAVQNYVSDSLTGIGGLAIADFRSNPIPIDVYIDPANPQNYYVDVADIPNLTPERIGELIKSAMQNKQGTTFANGEKPSTTPINPTLPPSHT